MKKGIIVHTLIKDNDKFLILERSKDNNTLPSYWDFPGGTCEDGENPYDSAVREVLEETGLKIDVPKLFYCYSNIDIEKNKQFFTLVFMAKYKGGEIKINPKEHTAYDWVDKENINEYKTVFYIIECLRHINSG